MKLNLKRILLTGLVAAGAAFGPAAAAQNIRIGFHVPLTGPAASDGLSAMRGAELAVEQINAAGGINGRKIELVVQDDQARADQAVPLANKYVGEGVKVMVSGSFSAPTRAAASVFQTAQIPYISAYAIHPDITRAGKYVFRTAFTGEVQGRAAAKVAGDLLAKKKVTLLTLNNDFGQSLAAGFKEAAGKFGIQIVSEYTFGMQDRQFGAVVASVRKDDPDAIFVVGYYYNGGPLVAQLRAAGIKAPIIGTEGFDSQHFLDIVKDAGEGLIVATALDRDTKSAVTRKFIEDFEAKYKTPADMVAASTHTAVNIAAEALRRAGPDDSAKIRDAIAGLKNFEVAAGRLTFNDLGESYKPAQIQVIKGGKYHHFATIDDPVLLAPPAK
jgi:branched-chain amino acid transport system substrate-binding protein